MKGEIQGMTQVSIFTTSKLTQKEKQEILRQMKKGQGLPRKMQARLRQRLPKEYVFDLADSVRELVSARK